MGNAFRIPDFRTGDLELRYENGVVCIYGTAEGLRQLAAFCQELSSSPEMSHIHLEDYPILTAHSEKGAIAIFPKAVPSASETKSLWSLFAGRCARLFRQWGFRD
ncbi:Imm32 family immunity protein [Thermostilla marina]